MKRALLMNNATTFTRVCHGTGSRLGCRLLNETGICRGDDVGTLGLSRTMGRPLPIAPLASSTLHVLAMASTKTEGSLAMTGEVVLRNCLTGMAAEGPPGHHKPCQLGHVSCVHKYIRW